MDDSAPTTIDWNSLRASAYAAMQRAYAPYSGYPVGAAAVSTSGLVTGMNVENVSISTAKATGR